MIADGAATGVAGAPEPQATNAAAQSRTAAEQYELAIWTGSESQAAAAPPAATSVPSALRGENWVAAHLAATMRKRVTNETLAETQSPRPAPTATKPEVVAPATNAQVATPEERLPTAQEQNATPPATEIPLALATDWPTRHREEAAWRKQQTARLVPPQPQPKQSAWRRLSTAFMQAVTVSPKTPPAGKPAPATNNHRRPILI